MFKTKNLIIVSCLLIAICGIAVFAILKREPLKPVIVYKTTTPSPKVEVRENKPLTTSQETVSDSVPINNDLPESEEVTEINIEPVDFSDNLFDESNFGENESMGESEESNIDYGSSSFGYGKYPDIPLDYPYTPIWTRSEESKQFYTDGDSEEERILELLSRVRIKLWEMGEKDIKGILYTDGLIYPNYPNTVYVDSSDGSVGVIGNPLSEEEMDLLQMGISPPGITVLDMSEGIEPISFLGL